MLILAENWPEIMTMDRRTFKSRLKKVRAAITLAGGNCLITAKPANVTYLTGFSGQDSWAIVMPRAVVLVTDSRYTEQAAKECRFCKIVERTGAITIAAAEAVNKHREIKKAVVEKTIPMADFRSLRKYLRCRLKDVEGIVESARRTKDGGEAETIIAAGKIAAKAFDIVRRRIKPGITENTLAGMLDFEIRKAGGTSSFETIVAFGPNASRPHHQPTLRKLRKNDTVLIDFGVRLNGYCCDLTRCFAVGTASAFYRKVYATVKQAQQAAIKTLKNGAEISKADNAARELIKKANLPVYGHGTGHGLGLEVHEQPTISNKAKGKLQTGDVVTIEPGVYIPGRFGVRIEDDCLVTNDGCVILTASCRKE
jgi:Xaa-Pro aminopeptidase